MSYIYGEARNQFTITSLDEQIGQDNPVRLIDLLVNLLFTEEIGETCLKGTNKTGRPAYHPRHMMKLFVYGYMNRIASSRRLEMEAQRNIELMWLINSVRPDFKTIADFRKDHQDTITNMTIKFNRMLRDKGLIAGELMALDGTKIKANAGAKELKSEKLTESIQEIEAAIQRYFVLLQQNDLKDDLDDLDANTMNTVELIEKKIKELQEKQAQLKDYQKVAASTTRGKVNPTDPESRFMKGQHESFAGYNVQVIVDSLFKLIAASQVTQSSNDLNEMIPALENLKETMDIEPTILLADNGYENIAALQTLELEGKTNALVMPKEESNEEENYKKSSFKYDEKKDCYYCPKGHELKRKGGIQKRKERWAQVYQCKKSTCAKCANKAKCNKSKEGRTITRYTDEKWVEEYHNKVKNSTNKALLKRRKAIVEHVFGTLKCWMGKIPLLLRGKRKVQTEINIYTTAYNLKRLIKLFGINGVISRLMANLEVNWDSFTNLPNINAAFPICFVWLRNISVYRTLSI